MADPTLDETLTAGQTGMLTDLSAAYRFINTWLTGGFWYTPTTLSTKVQADAAANPTPISWRVIGAAQLTAGVYTVVDADIMNGLDVNAVTATIRWPSTLTKFGTTIVRKRTGAAGTTDVTLNPGSGTRIDFVGGKTKITTAFQQASVTYLGNNYYSDGLQAYTCLGTDA